MRHLKGFTLVEVLITITILSILAGMVTYGINTVRTRSRDSQRVTELNRVKGALTQYYTVMKQYPTTDDYPTMVNELKSKGVLSEAPVDPINSPTYKYLYKSVDTDKDTFELWAKMETNNNHAVNDGGNHNTPPDNLYYEIGAGDNWQSLFPVN